MQQFKDKVFEKFLSGRDKSLHIHDVDIKRWALEINKELNISDFCASDRWLYYFKYDYGIVSRKITKLITSVTFETDIIKKSNEFLEICKNVINQVDPFCVINTDQTGFNYELYSKRTLSHIGEKTTSLIVSSMSSITHSYTVQPAITMNGKLLSKFYLCLKETNGNFGPRVQSELPTNFPNVIIRCSSSGKMTKDLVIDFNQQIIQPLYQQKIVYIADSWSGQTNSEIYENIFGNQCEFLQIPPHCTSIVQPLDVYFFRFWKLIAKKIYNEVLLHSWNVDLKQRNQIIKLHCLIHNQLSSSIFENLICYSWFRSGYLTERPIFNDVSEVCFPKLLDNCQIFDCTRHSFINCSHCNLSLCFGHFFIEVHSHF